MPFESKSLSFSNLGKVLISAMVLSGVVWLWADISLKRVEMFSTGKVPMERKYVTVSGEGKITAVPDIAMVSVGLMTRSKTVAEAQAENTRKFNAIVAGLKNMGIESKDLKTSNYSIYPEYQYNDGKSTIIGYNVSQNVEVKVRALDKVSAVLDLAGANGANQVGGLQFTVDEPQTLEGEAREEAIADAQSKAAMLAKKVGFRLGKVVNFSEGTNMPTPYPIYARDMMTGSGMKAEAAPAIESGSLDVTSMVTLTYEIE